MLESVRDRYEEKLRVNEIELENAKMIVAEAEACT